MGKPENTEQVRSKSVVLSVQAAVTAVPVQRWFATGWNLEWNVAQFYPVLRRQGWCRQCQCHGVCRVLWELCPGLGTQGVQPPAWGVPLRDTGADGSSSSSAAPWSLGGFPMVWPALLHQQVTPHPDTATRLQVPHTSHTELLFKGFGFFLSLVLS